MVRLVLGALAAVLLVPAAAPASQFQSPSKNIGCVIDRRVVRCDILEKDWSPPPKPSSCEFEWGFGLQFRRTSSQGRFVCASDTAAGAGPRLAYGRSINRGGNRCTSSQAGIRCRNGRGHGFFVSRQRYRRF